MKKLVLLVWLMLPVLVGFYHFGPGQEQAVLDSLNKILAEADRDAADQAWGAAESKYEAALSLLPADRIQDARRIRLEIAKVQMQNRKLPVAHQSLKALVDELRGDPDVDQPLLAESRAALANSQYYMTWLMRLEGQPKDRWEPEIEAARQTFRLLAGQAETAGDASLAKSNREDLESVIQLARMDLSDLQGLPLPSQ
ncbi:MAG: hypothetical protein QGF59_32715 [Pirellulaceae bacterium]|jgi:hypothetical protein|nr:hypothetical protein [Pirellulaceae bacterium]MDP6723473.1 hypothetical protein [Pirellulaceae bacterium]